MVQLSKRTQMQQKSHYLSTSIETSPSSAMGGAGVWRHSERREGGGAGDRDRLRRGDMGFGASETGRQGGWLKGVVIFAKVVTGAYSCQLLELPFRHLLQQLPHCLDPEPVVPLLSRQVAEPDYLQELESAVSLA